MFECLYVVMFVCLYVCMFVCMLNPRNDRYYELLLCFANEALPKSKSQDAVHHYEVAMHELEVRCLLD